MRRFLILPICFLMGMQTASAENERASVLLSDAEGLPETFVQNIRDFEDICLPFIFHETELQRDADMAFYQKEITALAFEPMKYKLGQYRYQRARFQTVQAFTSAAAAAAPKTELSLVWSSDRTEQKRPAHSCRLKFSAETSGMTRLWEKLQGDDKAWQKSSQINTFKVYDGVSMTSINAPMQSQNMGLCLPDEDIGIVLDFEAKDNSLEGSMKISVYQYLGPVDTKFKVVYRHPCDFPTE